MSLDLSKKLIGLKIKITVQAYPSRYSHLVRITKAVRNSPTK
jgi:hypothetical protein